MARIVCPICGGTVAVSVTDDFPRNIGSRENDIFMDEVYMKGWLTGAAECSGCGMRVEAFARIDEGYSVAKARILDKLSRGRCDYGALG